MSIQSSPCEWMLQAVIQLGPRAQYCYFPGKAEWPTYAFKSNINSHLHTWECSACCPRWFPSPDPQFGVSWLHKSSWYTPHRSTCTSSLEGQQSPTPKIKHEVKRTPIRTRRFSNHESRLLSRSHTFAIIVILDFWKYIKICGYTDPFFQKLESKVIDP